MNFHAIFSTLRRQKVVPLLMAVQVAVTAAVVFNVMPNLLSRVDRLSIDSGVSDEATLFSIKVASQVKDAEQLSAIRKATLERLTQIPLVTGSSLVDSIPFGMDQSSYGLCSSREALEHAMALRRLQGVDGCEHVTFVKSAPHAVQTLGLKLVGGRDFSSGDFSSTDVENSNASGSAIPVIISTHLARVLFNADASTAVGKTLIMGSGTNLFVVGIVESLIAPNPRNPEEAYNTLLTPNLPGDGSINYLARARSDSADLRNEVVKRVLDGDSKAILLNDVRSFKDVRGKFFASEIAMSKILVASLVSVLLISFLTIAALSVFWVDRHRRIIGIRRALGATKTDISLYSIEESLWITVIGLALGGALGWAGYVALKNNIEVAAPGILTDVVTFVATILVVQAATMFAVRRAVSVPPAIAARS